MGWRERQTLSFCLMNGEHPDKPPPYPASDAARMFEVAIEACETEDKEWLEHQRLFQEDLEYHRKLDEDRIEGLSNGTLYTDPWIWPG
jgi:hypothetical protein